MFVRTLRIIPGSTATRRGSTRSFRFEGRAFPRFRGRMHGRQADLRRCLCIRNNAPDRPSRIRGTVANDCPAALSHARPPRSKYGPSGSDERPTTIYRWNRRRGSKIMRHEQIVPIAGRTKAPSTGFSSTTLLAASSRPGSDRTCRFAVSAHAEPHRNRRCPIPRGQRKKRTARESRRNPPR